MTIALKTSENYIDLQQNSSFLFRKFCKNKVLKTDIKQAIMKRTIANGSKENAKKADRKS